jgi:hypothetical protein
MERRQIIETFGGNVLDVWHLRNEDRFLTGRGIYTITNEMKWPGVKLTTDQLQIDVAFRNGMSQRLNVSWVNSPLYRNRRPLLVCPNPQCLGRRYERLYLWRILLQEVLRPDLWLQGDQRPAEMERPPRGNLSHLWLCPATK